MDLIYSDDSDLLVHSGSSHRLGTIKYINALAYLGLNAEL
jgi:hypothetical protein